MAELESYAKAIAKTLKPAMKKAEEPKAQRDIFGTVRAVGSGNSISYEVMLDGSDSYAPCAPTVEVHAGDRVVCHIVNHRIIVFSNLTVPSVNDQGYQHVKDIATEANELLDGVSAAAASADKSLAEIIADSVTANDLVSEIETYVGYAEGYTQTLADRVEEVDRDAQQGIEDIAEDVAAVDAAYKAADAAIAADVARVEEATSEALEDIGESVQAASDAAAEADRKAGLAAEAASAAQDSADTATLYATSALGQLGVVQDVIGVLTWASEHGSFQLTSDSEIQDGKVYFTYDSGTGDYTPVIDAQESALSTYYELTVDEAMDSFIMSHLAVTQRGLWVLPGGINTGSVTPETGEALVDARARLGNNYKMLLANDGTYIYDGSGHLVTTYGESITFDSSRPQYIGNEDAYIFYTPASGNTPAHITIGGSYVEFGSTPLSELLADVESAVQTANDVPIVTLSSTNGTVFKRNLGVSTTIVATVFTPGGRIDNATELHRRFGNGAYLEWGWRDVVTDASHVLLSSDERIGNGGFTLTVNPEDVDSQAVITCSLNY